MADIWSGDILLPDGNTVTDIGLASRNVASSTTIPVTTLRFLSTVDTAKIPLYLAAGPSLDVWTTSEDTETWFESILLSKPTTTTGTSGNAGTNEWWHLARSQSPIGILVQVQNTTQEAQKPRVTEILFYGTIATPVTAPFPTPPSSSPHLHNLPARQLPELRVHALPLSSDLLYHQSAKPSVADEAQFLPPLRSTHFTPESPKRKRDIFEEATIANRKARGRGGQGVAAAAARANESQPQPYSHRKSLSVDTKASPFPDVRPPSANGTLPRTNPRQLSRSPSISSDTRPLSRKGTDGHGKRSNLSQVVTVPLQPEEPTTESRNKEALSRVVMAAMRMHGLQQRRKTRSRHASMAPGVEENQQMSEETGADEGTKDDEFKLIYHQTYKGAALALRKHMADKPMHTQPARFRDVVERLLTIFLSDPLAEAQPSEESANPVATPGSKQKLSVPGSKHSHASPFDLPSISRPRGTRSVADGQVFTGSPVSRRKVNAT